MRPCPAPVCRTACAALALALASLLPAPLRGDEGFETTVTGQPDDAEALADDRATATLQRRDLDRRLPRSAPDALRFEPGVFVQQSAHGQGSAYLRGLTGQQTLLLFDGVRLNTSTWRQGPNQYFFTLDSRTLRSVEVQRGGGSTRWGSDALGGVIDAHPIDPGRAGSGLRLEPRLLGRLTTADSELGGRFQVEATGRPGGVEVGFVGGAGSREVGRLDGPPVLNPDATTEAGELPWIPRYEEYDPTLPLSAQRGRLRTQLGTGFRELTADGRLVIRPSAGQRLTLAGYLYRQSEAPRTDQCPPPAAPWDQCLTYEEQFRHLVYGAWDARGSGLLAEGRATLSFQEQHERRRLDLTAANLRGRGVDDVRTLGASLSGRTRDLLPGAGLAVRAEAGADAYLDLVSSRADHVYTDTLDVVSESRGQYLDGSRYLTAGAFASAEARLSRVAARAGGRLGWAWARAPGDADSGTAAVDRAWVPWAAHAGVEVRPAEALRLFANWDSSFRAPNLDDLTSRQQTGPGFQFENPDLGPERAHTLEVGARWRSRAVAADLWAFETLLEGALLKVPRSYADCPPQTPQCQSSWSRFQLQNAPELSELRGVEAAVRVSLPARLHVRATAAYVHSEGPRVGELGDGTIGVVPGERVPLSRTPPLHGTAELGWSHPRGLSAGVGLQWAAAQHRLALADYADGRIPKYGTPGFAVVHLRAGYRLGDRVGLAVVLENLFDSPYRFHGSSVNGAGRGLMVQLELAPPFEPAQNRSDP